MKIASYTIVKWEDLKDTVKDRMIGGLMDEWGSNKEAHEWLSRDVFDMGEIDPDVYIEDCVRRACESSWAEWEVEVKL